MPVDIEKELKDLPNELRVMRAKKQDLEAEINKLDNQRFKVLEDTIKAKEELSVQAKLLADKKTEALEANNKLKSVKTQVSAELKVLEDKKLELLAIEEKNKDIEHKNNIIIESNKNTDGVLRAKNSALDEKQREFDKEKSIFNATKKLFEEAKLEFAKEIEAFAQKQVKVEKDKQDAEDTLIKGNEIISVYENKLKEVESLKSVLDNQIKATKNLENSLSLKNKEAEENNIELTKQIEKNKQLQAQLEKRIDEQQAKDKEIEIRRLRVEKLARDKDIQKELKELEDDLKG